MNPGASLATRAGDLEIGFDVYPLDGSVATTRLGAGAGLPATRLHLPRELWQQPMASLSTVLCQPIRNWHLTLSVSR